MRFRLGDVAEGAEAVRSPCFPKRRHATEAEAQAHLREQIEQERPDGPNVETLNVYACRDCGVFHIGHDKYAQKSGERACLHC